MTLLEFVNLLKSTGYPVAYSHFIDTESTPTPNPPFICYVLPETDNFTADNKVYHKITDVDVELYTDCKDYAAEKKIEDVFDQNNIAWDSYETYNESERLFQKIYEVRLI